MSSSGTVLEVGNLDLDLSAFDQYSSRGTRWHTRELEVRKKIFKMSRAENNISYMYRELLWL